MTGTVVDAKEEACRGGGEKRHLKKGCPKKTQALMPGDEEGRVLALFLISGDEGDESDGDIPDLEDAQSVFGDEE